MAAPVAPGAGSASAATMVGSPSAPTGSSCAGVARGPGAGGRRSGPRWPPSTTAGMSRTLMTPASATPSAHAARPTASCARASSRAGRPHEVGRSGRRRQPGRGQDRVLAGVPLQAPRGAARAGRPVGVDADVADLARPAVAPGHAPAVDDDRPADADLPGEVDEVAEVARPARRGLAPPCGPPGRPRCRRGEPARRSPPGSSAGRGVQVRPRRGWGRRSRWAALADTTPGSASPAPTSGCRPGPAASTSRPAG